MKRKGICSAGTFSWTPLLCSESCRPNLLERFMRKHPVERILFGSDSPWTDQSEELSFLMELPFLSEGEKEKITGKNAAELLGLPKSLNPAPR